MTNSPWFDQALKYLGQAEDPAHHHNQFILDCFSYTSYKAASDSVAWCSAFVNRVLAESAFKGTGSAAAVSFADPGYGEACELKQGAILVFQWSNGHHHVGLCHHVVNDDYVAVLGGNQHDRVQISVFPRKCLIAIKWPNPIA